LATNDRTITQGKSHTSPITHQPRILLHSEEKIGSLRPIPSLWSQLKVGDCGPRENSRKGVWSPVSVYLTKLRCITRPKKTNHFPSVPISLLHILMRHHLLHNISELKREKVQIVVGKSRELENTRTCGWEGWFTVGVLDRPHNSEKASSAFSVQWKGISVDSSKLDLSFSQEGKRLEQGLGPHPCETKNPVAWGRITLLRSCKLGEEPGTGGSSNKIF